MAEPGPKAIDLPRVVDLDALDGVRDRLLEAIEAGPVTVLGNGVERVSTNALIMLLSAAETAKRNHFSFALRSPSEAMRTAIERLGLGERFAAMKGH